MSVDLKAVAAAVNVSLLEGARAGSRSLGYNIEALKIRVQSLHHQRKGAIVEDLGCADSDTGSGKIGGSEVRHQQSIEKNDQQDRNEKKKQRFRVRSDRFSDGLKYLKGSDHWASSRKVGWSSDIFAILPCGSQLEPLGIAR
jgi:hypothetical protein